MAALVAAAKINGSLACACAIVQEAVAVSWDHWFMRGKHVHRQD
jgi:hypothetical protein